MGSEGEWGDQHAGRGDTASVYLKENIYITVHIRYTVGLLIVIRNICQM